MLQDWIALPSIAAENVNYPKGAEYMAQLARADEQLESLGERRVVAIAPSKRRDVDRVAGDECGANE